MFEKITIVAGIVILALISTNLCKENSLLENKNEQLEQQITVLKESYDSALKKHKELYTENLKLQEEINNAICESKDWSNTPVPNNIRNSITRMLKSSTITSDNGRNKN